jgi:hypothetical protein
MVICTVYLKATNDFHILDIKAGDKTRYTLLLQFPKTRNVPEFRTMDANTKSWVRCFENELSNCKRLYWPRKGRRSCENQSWPRFGPKVGGGASHAGQPRCLTVRTLVVDRGLSPLPLTSMFPSVQQIEEVLESLEDIVYASLSAATPDLPRVRETFDRLWDDVSRFGPNLPDIHVRVPGLGDFHVPPPPPPPPPPKGMVEKLIDWCQENPWTVLGVGVGAGLLVGYGSHKYRVHRRQRVRHISTTSIPRERRQVVGAYLISLSALRAKSYYHQVVLGGDRPIGLPLILDLEKRGYIVIASVEDSATVESIEAKTHGYVRALVLEPTNVRPSIFRSTSTHRTPPSPTPFRSSFARSRPVSPISSQSTLPETHMYPPPLNPTFYLLSLSSLSLPHLSPLLSLWNTSHSSQPTSRTLHPPTLSPFK